MKKIFKSFLVIIMVFVLSFSSTINAYAVTTRETDVAAAKSGNVLVTVSGKYSGNLTKASSGTSGKRNQIMEVKASNVKILTDNIIIGLNDTAVNPAIDLTINKIRSGKLYKADSMSIANDSVVELTDDGKLKPVGVGNTKLTVTYGGSYTKDIYVSVQ